MLQFVKKIVLLLLFIGSSMSLWANPEVLFEVVAPKVVAVGEAFRVEYKLNARVDDFRQPNITEFDVIAGPTESSGQSISIVNGDVTRSVNVSYTYVLSARKKGVSTIPSAVAVVDGEKYTSKPLVVEVADEQTQQNSSSTGINADDIIVRMIVNNKNVYRGEPIKLTIKLYSRLSLNIQNQKLPSFNGFWVQKLEGSAQPHRETLNSKVYDAVVLREYLLFPQQSGELEIGATDVDVVAQIISQSRTNRRSVFDDFFGGGVDVREIRRKVSAEAIKINVKELPAGAPASFSGAVGQFKLAGKASSDDMVANSSLTYTMRISGMGNLPLIQAPVLKFPNSFELYNVKTTESFNVSREGISGYRQFEYPIIVRAEGEYNIEPIDFSFFNPKISKYVTLRTNSAEIKVLPDSTSTGRDLGAGALVSGLSKEEVKILDQDVRFIKIDEPELHKDGNIFILSLGYFLSILGIVVLFVATLVYLQKRIKEMQNSVLVRGKKANKVALRRLKNANKHILENNQHKFYEEMLRALWGYMSDKLNIPVSNLTKDNVREGLHKNGASNEDVNLYMELISECELAQYSPSASGQMQDIYRGAVVIISKFESTIKR